MEKIKTYAQLKSLNVKNKVVIDKRLGDVKTSRKDILVCAGTGCMSSKSEEIISVFKEQIKTHKLEKIEVHGTGCFGFCEKGPIVKVMPENIFYSKMTAADAIRVVKEHLVGGKIVKDKLYIDPQGGKVIKEEHNIPFYAKQKRIALKYCGVIDAESVDEAIGADVYLALGKVLNEYTPEAVIKQVKESGLRGRGGGGFPTGLKWEFARKSTTEGEKYVICNADEGDPGAFMDRSILEGNPHSILEAMAINGYAIGSQQGYIYIRAEYPTAVKRLQKAIKQARELGLIGENILGSGFNFDIEIRLGAGAFVCGEETALIASIEGYRGMSRNKPPFPAIKGLWGKSTNVNNVETYANINPIILKGASWYSSFGTEKSKGTKVFALGGKVKNSGLIEVPMGITLREVIYDIGGGITNDRKFKAIQTGGPSGGCLVEKHLDEKIDYDNLIALGSMMGSGGMIVMDEDNCMVDVARFYMDFIVEESCGKCTPCREGSRRMLEILNIITDGLGKMEHLEELKTLGEVMKDASLCGLGQTAPNPVLSTLKHFEEEYIAHVKGDIKSCPAGVCAALTKLEITDACIGCTKCALNCPVNCISGSLKEKHVIDVTQCIACGACKKSCPVHAIITV